MENKDKTKKQPIDEVARAHHRIAELDKSETEYRQVEKRLKLMSHVLELLNQSSEKIDTIHNILLLIKEYGKFEAVGIRLREGEDFPYYVTNGFPEPFVEAEKYLCARDHAQELIRDSEGNPVLECMCGNIICGRTNPSLPFFTEHGSFWSNCTTELLASTSEEDLQARTRNRCNGEGYESVALVPLRSDNEIIGLLQLNDRRKNMFTLGMIKYYEEIGASIGIALARKQAEEQIIASLKEKEWRLRKNLEETINALALAVEMRDPYTAGHQRRVATLACNIAQEMKLPTEQTDGLRLAGLIHDIGKIQTPAEILTKPKQLSEAEFFIIKMHPQIGYDILKAIEFPYPIAKIILQHHERMDGSGYPTGLRNEEILLESKIMAVADVVEAMSFHRPYRPALGVSTVLEEITKHRKNIYDDKVVEVCMKLFLEKKFSFEKLPQPNI